MKCKRCDKEFAAKRTTRKFCSDACRQRNHRPNAITRYNNLVEEYNALADLYDEINPELTRLYDQVELLLAERALAKAAEEAAKKMIK